MQEINGFTVIGSHWVTEKGVYKCHAKCKVCRKKFETNFHSLQRMKSCGCARPSKLKPLLEYINGFKIIKCLGYDKESKTRWAIVECKECKKEYKVDPRKLKYRKHCGCMKKNVVASKYAKTHPQLGRTFNHMKGRCYNKNNQDYYNYGERGITICDEWLEDRNRFCEWSIANGFEEGKGLSIDRIDNNKGYCPENCRWSTPLVQSRNTRRTKLTYEIAEQIRKDLKTMTSKNVSKKYGISHGSVAAIKNKIIWKE